MAFGPSGAAASSMVIPVTCCGSFPARSPLGASVGRRACGGEIRAARASGSCIPGVSLGAGQPGLGDSRVGGGGGQGVRWVRREAPGAGESGPRRPDSSELGPKGLDPGEIGAGESKGRKVPAHAHLRVGGGGGGTGGLATIESRRPSHTRTGWGAAPRGESWLRPRGP